MKTLAERLKFARENLSLSQQEVAKLAGISQPTYFKIENGLTLKPRNILDIAKALKVRADWLATGQGQMTAKPTIEALKSKADEIMGRTNGVEYTQPAHLYPVINEVQAGHFTELGQDSFDEWRPAHHKGSYWLRIKGDSMTPDFAQGDLILVDKDRIASTGNYVVAQVADDPKATFKKYRECFDDDKPYYQLIAINDFYPIIDSRAKPFEVIGVVVEHSRGLV